MEQRGKRETERERGIGALGRGRRLARLAKGAASPQDRDASERALNQDGLSFVFFDSGILFGQGIFKYFPPPPPLARTALALALALALASRQARPV